MKLNETIYAKTNAEFLNTIFGTHYKAWMKSAWTYSLDTIVWMVRIDGKERTGWKNTFSGKDKIIQENCRHVWDWNNNPVDIHNRYKRLVFEIVGDGASRKYIFRGVFKCNEKKTDPLNFFYYDKIADEF